MKKPTLILNSDYMPHSMCDWKSAVTLAYAKDKEAYVVATYEDYIKDTMGRVYNLPAVIVLNDYMSENNKICPYSKKAVHLRDRYTCQYCGKVCTENTITIDHVIPKSSKNKLPKEIKLNSFENCVSACPSCNRKKANKTLLESGLRLRRQPKSITKAQRVYYSIVTKAFPLEWEPYIQALPYN